MSQIRNLDEAFDTFDELYAPRIIAEVNDYHVRIAKVEGDHTWHSHAETDEFFLVLAGEFTLNFRDQESAVLKKGDTYVVEKGVEHFPQATPGTRILLFEPRETVSTGESTASHVASTAGLNL